MKLAALGVIGVLLLTGRADAQLVTGSLVGVVRDQSGAVLPGVSVTLHSPSLPSAGVSTVTGAAGEYRFTELAAGTYSLTAALQGFGDYREEGLRVNLGGTIERVVTMKIGTVGESITVTGESPLVDVRRVGTAANVPQETLENIPVSRFRASELAKWTPGVAPSSPGTDSDAIRVMGSTNDENSVFYDGALNKAADDGRALQAGMADTIAEMQVTTLGASAEYQVAQGAVINMVFKSGTNQFHWDASAYFYPDSLISKPVKAPCNCPEGVTGYTQNQLDDYAGNAGGPIVKDKLWFYGGFKYNVRDWTVPGGNPADERVWWGHGTLAKLTWQAKPGLSFRQTFSSTFWDTPGSITTNRPFDTVTKAPGQSHIYVSEMLATVKQSTLVTLRATGLISPVPIGYPLNDDIETPYSVESSTNVGCCGVPDFGARTSNRHVISGKVARFLPGDRVSHDLRGGIQFERADFSRYSTRPSGVNFTTLNGQPDQASYRDPWVSGGEYSTQGIWIEDQLTIGNRFTLSVGTRFDRMHASSQDLPARDTELNETGATVKGLGDLFTWNVFVPRVGFNLKLSDSGKAILRGHYGRAYRQVFINDLIGVHPGNSPITLKRWNPATSSYSTVISVTDPTANVGVDSELDAPYTDSYSIGMDRQLSANVAFGITLVHKKGAKRIGWEDVGGVYGTRTDLLPDGSSITVFPLLNSPSARKFMRTNGPGTFSEYTGIVTSIERRFAHGWRASGSYTYGKDEGLETTNQDPNLDINADGELGRPHVVTVMASYEIPKIQVQVVANYMGASGDTYAPQALIQLPQGRLSVNIAKADGTYRMPRQDILGLRFARMMFRNSERRVEIGAEIRNALQNTANVSVTSQNLFGTTFGQGNAWVDPRRAVLFLRGYF